MEWAQLSCCRYEARVHQLAADVVLDGVWRYVVYTVATNEVRAQGGDYLSLDEAKTAAEGALARILGHATRLSAQTLTIDRVAVTVFLRFDRWRFYVYDVASGALLSQGGDFDTIMACQGRAMEALAMHVDFPSDPPPWTAL